MTNKRTKKSALISSAIALLLCCSMLIGTTFAWFTDSVTSANNIIKSGNLDVELYYQVEGQNDWTKVTSSTNVFMEDALWEPGHTEVVKLKVVNEGSLALKYHLGVNIASEVGSVNAEGEDFLLSDYIKYGVVEGAQDYSREQAVSAVDATATTLKTSYNSDVIELLPKADAATAEDVYTDVVTMVVYMPETVGNEANHATGAAQPTIKLGINLFATQYTYEEDSFGEDYDVDALLMSAYVPVDGNATAPVVLETGDVEINLPAALINNLPAGVDSIAISYAQPEVDASGNVVSFAAIELVDQNQNVIDLDGNTIPFEVKLPAQTAIAANEDVVVLHDGEVVAVATVAADGTIAYEANHLCAVSVVAVTKVATASELKAAIAAGENVQFTADITTSDKLVITADAAFFGFGNTLTYTGNLYAIDADNGVVADLFLDDLTINCTASGCQRGINYNVPNGKLTLNKVTISGNANYAINLRASSDNAVITINDSNITGNTALNVWGENTVIVANNTTFRSDYISEVEACSVIKLNMDASGNAATGSTLTVNGGAIISDANLTAVEIVCADVKLSISPETNVQGNILEPMALVVYEGQTEFYTSFSLESAIARAKNVSNATIVLLKDIKLVSFVNVDGSLKIDGNGHTITSSATRIFRITKGDVDLTISDLNMVSTAAVAYPNDVRGISIDSDFSNIKLTLNNCSVKFTDPSAVDWAYAVNLVGTSTGHVITINGGTYEGSNVINVRGANNTVVVKNATLNCTYADNGQYYGACIWVQQNMGSSVEASGNTFNGNNAIAFNLGTGTVLVESNNVDNTFTKN